jgi:hypothetical protein
LDCKGGKLTRLQHWAWRQRGQSRTQPAPRPTPACLLPLRVLSTPSCPEFLRLVTNKGRTFEIGNKDSPSQLISSYPNRPSGFLASVRGYEEVAKSASGAVGRGPLKTLQFIWANCNALPGAGGSEWPGPRAAACAWVWGCLPLLRAQAGSIVAQQH